MWCSEVHVYRSVSCMVGQLVNSFSAKEGQNKAVVKIVALTKAEIKQW